MIDDMTYKTVLEHLEYQLHIDNPTNNILRIRYPRNVIKGIPSRVEMYKYDNGYLKFKSEDNKNVSRRIKCPRYSVEPIISTNLMINLKHRDMALVMATDVFAGFKIKYSKKEKNQKKQLYILLNDILHKRDVTERAKRKDVLLGYELLTDLLKIGGIK